MDGNNDNGLIITRVFDASREMVWRAWTDPTLYMKWWGPKDFTCPDCQIDLRVGGHCISSMQGADEKKYWSIGTYTEIVAPEKLAYTDSFADDNGNPVPASYYNMPGEWPAETQVTITLEEEEGKTKMTLHHANVPEGEQRELCQQGWNQSFDKLVEALKWVNVTP